MHSALDIRAKGRGDMVGHRVYRGLQSLAGERRSCAPVNSSRSGGHGKASPIVNRVKTYIASAAPMTVFRPGSSRCWPLARRFGAPVIRCDVEPDISPIFAKGFRGVRSLPVTHGKSLDRPASTSNSCRKFSIGGRDSAFSHRRRSPLKTFRDRLFRFAMRHHVSRRPSGVWMTDSRYSSGPM